MEFVLSCINISIHAPREGSDKQGHGTISPTTHFYPRSPRGERPGAEGLATAYSRISIHAPREGSDLPVPMMNILNGGISIHAPREGSDAAAGWAAPQREDFYPRSPRGERPSRPRLPASVWNFYPRSPRGERQGRFDFYHPMLAFLSTLPARGATAVRRDRAPVPGISIHAPREGSDPSNSAARAHPVISIHAPREGSD